MLLGRAPFVLDDVRAAIDPALDVEILTGTSVDDVSVALAGHRIDTVIMGAGIDLSTRLEIVRRTFEASDATTVHMNDRASGRGGMMPFVNAVIGGLATHGDRPATGVEVSSENCLTHSLSGTYWARYVSPMNATTFGTLGGPSRLQIVELLRQGSMTEIGPKAKLAAFGMKWGYKQYLDKPDSSLSP